jgi:hypothetical protein
MIGALLPLPPDPVKEMQERDNSTSNLSEVAPVDYSRYLGAMDEVRYESAKWWRRVNRTMSFVGLVVLASIVSTAVDCFRFRTDSWKIVLIVISLRERW